MEELPEWLAREYPFPRHELTVDWGRIHFVDTRGNGRPVLLLHGNPTWSFLYRKVMRELADSGLRLVAPDLIGLGLSDKPRSIADHSLARHGQSILQFVEQLNLRNILLVVQDWGGPIGTWMASQAPERVTGLLLMNTAVLHPKRFKTTAFHRFSQMPFLSDVVFRGFNFPVPVMNRVQGDPKSISPLARRAYFWPLRRIMDRAAPLAMARMVPNRADHPTVAELEKTDAWVRSFKGPAEMVWGVRDPILGNVLKRMREALPQVPVTETQAGHFLQEEVPEVIAGAIRRIAGLAAKT